MLVVEGEEDQTTTESALSYKCIYDAEVMAQTPSGKTIHGSFLIGFRWPDERKSLHKTINGSCFSAIGTTCPKLHRRETGHQWKHFLPG